jgi:hypothetical protein
MTPTLGSIVQKGKLAAWALALDRQLNKVDLPTLGSPTIPHFNDIFYIYDLLIYDLLFIDLRFVWPAKLRISAENAKGKRVFLLIFGLKKLRGRLNGYEKGREREMTCCYFGFGE